MATSKNTSTIESARIAGAKKGLDALRKLERAAETGTPGDTAAKYYAERLSDARAYVAALGPMTPEQEGAIAVLAEYLHMNLTAGAPCLEPLIWTPLSAMTEAERQAMVEQLDAEHEADNAAIEQRQKAARKVVSMADWMATQ